MARSLQCERQWAMCLRAFVEEGHCCVGINGSASLGVFVSRSAAASVIVLSYNKFVFTRNSRRI